MRDLAILTFVTLDGVMQAPSMPEEDPSGGFEAGGWAAPYWEGVMAQVRKEAMAAPYDMLFGRKTYDLFASHWPNVDKADPEARMMNGATKYVATNRQVSSDWENTTPVTGDVPAEIVRLKQEDGPLLQVHGSGALIQTLLAHDLVDELRLWTFPVVVGSGKRLFADSASMKSFKLVKSEPCDNGVVMTIYRRERPDA